jgi:hypothetical protein
MRLVLIVAVAISLGACAGYPLASSPSPGNPETSSPGVAYDAVVVTEQDRIAAVRVGQTLLLELHAKPGMTDWNGVTSSVTSALGPLTIDVMVPRGLTLAAFEAVSQGQFTVTAVAGALCPQGQPCPAYAVRYSLRVTVGPG